MAVAICAPPPASANGSAQVRVSNQTKDASVWVTAYNGKNLGAWCVPPGKVDTHGLSSLVTQVRAEVTHTNCSHPVMLDQTLSFMIHDSATSYHTVSMFYVSGEAGNYKFFHY